MRDTRVRRHARRKRDIVDDVDRIIASLFERAAADEKKEKSRAARVSAIRVKNGRVKMGDWVVFEKFTYSVGDTDSEAGTVTLFLKDFFGESVGVNVVSLKEMMIAKKISKEDWEPGVED